MRSSENSNSRKLMRSPLDAAKLAEPSRKGSGEANAEEAVSCAACGAIFPPLSGLGPLAAGKSVIPGGQKGDGSNRLDD